MKAFKAHKDDDSSMKEFRAAYDYAKRGQKEPLDPRISLFKDFWRRNYNYISLELTDDQILSYVVSSPSIQRAADLVSDYLLANGLSEVQP
jgi:hypothetical protein